MLSLIGMVFLREVLLDSPLLPSGEPNKQMKKKIDKRVKRAGNTVSQTGGRWKVGEGYMLNSSGKAWAECIQW